MDTEVAIDASSKLSDVRKRMKEKRCGSLKTAKQNAFLASKIKNKIKNNSSIITVSLKQNNKALALALNSEKVFSQRLLEDNKLLMSEIEVGMFRNARLRKAISYMNKVLRELESYISVKLQYAIRESHPSTLSEDINIENSFTDVQADKHRNSSSHRSIKLSLKDPTTDVENEKQPDVGLKDLFLQQTKSPQTQNHLGLEEPSNSDGESQQVNAISILESEVADALSGRKSEGPCCENKSEFWPHVTQRKKWAPYPYLNCQITTMIFERDVCSNRFSQWTNGPQSPVREINRQEASSFSWLSDPLCDPNSNISRPEDAMPSGQLPEEIMSNEKRSFSSSEQDRSVTTSRKNQNKITGNADKDVASPLRFVKCVFTEQELRDTVGIYPIKNLDNNSKNQSQNLITLSPEAQTSSKLALIPSIFPTEMDSLGENPTPISGPPEDQFYHISDRFSKCRQTYLCSEVCSNKEEKTATPPSGKRKKTLSEKQIEVKNQSPNSNCGPISMSLCGNSGRKQLLQKNKVTDKLSNEINKETKQLRNRMSTDKHDALSKGNDYKEKSRKESDRLRKTMDQQIPNTTNQTTQDLPTVRTLSVEILQKMTESPLEQEVSRRVYDTKNCDCREENVIPLEGKLKPDSQEYELKPRGRQLKWGKSQQKKEGSLSNKKETPISDSKQSSVRDLSNRKRQGQKSYIGNSRIPKLTSCSVEPGLNKMCPASAKNMKDIQNNVNKKTPSLAGRLNATRDVAPSMTKAKQKAENVLPAKDQSDFGKKIVSETLSGKYESTEVDRMMQNEVYNGLSKTDRNFCQSTIQKLVLNSPMSLELSYVVTLSPEKTVRTSLTAFQVQEPHLANDSVLTTFPAGLESCQTTKGRTSSSGPKDRWSVAVFPRGSPLSNKTPKKENQESHNLENTRLASPFSTSKFLRDSSTMLRSSLRRKDNLISYREPRLNCKLRRGNTFTDAASSFSNKQKTGNNEK